MGKHIINLYVMKKPKRINEDNKRSKVHENRKHMHKMTSARDHAIFVKS